MLFTCIHVIAQQPHIFIRFSSRDGLRTNNIRCVWQDNKGFIWIGTENGLQRYDGKKFVRFIHGSDAQSIPPKAVEQILDAGEGRLWLKQENDVGLFDTRSLNYSKIPVIPRGKLSPLSNSLLFRDSKGRTFMCIRQYGLLEYDSVINRFTDSEVTSQLPANWDIQYITEDTVRGYYWMTSDSGLVVYNQRTREVYTRYHNPLGLSLLKQADLIHTGRFIIAQDGTFWFTRWIFSPTLNCPVLVHFDPARGRFLTDTTGLVSTYNGYTELNVLLQSRNGQFWAAGVNALYCQSQGNTGVERIPMHQQAEYAINCDKVYSMMEDNEQNIWIATDNGLFITYPYQTKVFSLNLQKDESMLINIEALKELSSKENWLATWGYGMLAFDKTFRQIPTSFYKGLSHKEQEICQQSWDFVQHRMTGKLVVGCQGGYVNIIDPDQKKLLHVLRPPVMAGSTVRKVKEDVSGRILFGTQRGLLTAMHITGKDYNKAEWEVLQQFSSAVNCMFVDSSGKIWVAVHNNGIYQLDTSGKKIIGQYIQNERPGFSLSHNSIYDIIQYNDSLFIASASNGLNVINRYTGRIRYYTTYDGLPGANVTQLLKDNKGEVWLITNNGLASFNLLRSRFISYNYRDGVVNAEKATRAKWVMNNGEIWFGGNNVAFGVLPEKLKFNRQPPDVTITDFKLIDKFIPFDSLQELPEVNLSYNQHSFTIYFSSLSFADQEKLTYYCRLSGVDKDWVQADNYMANYTMLPPGSYTFSVKCENIEGLVSRHITTLKIRIRPPFYKTLLFKLIALFVVAALVYLIYRLRINRLLAVERVRNKVARDLHDDMGSTLSTINILSSMAKTRLSTDPVKTSEYLSKITDNSQRMMEAMDDIVWSIKPDNDSMQKIIARMREYANSVLEAKNINMHFTVSDKVTALRPGMETRRDIFLIFKEAVNNIAKYAHCTDVQIDLQSSNQRLVMRVSDNGVGFIPETADSGNGLGNMQKRAALLNGKLTITSAPGAGTELLLNVPV